MNPIRLRIITAGQTRYLFTDRGRWSPLMRGDGSQDTLLVITSEPVLLSFALEDHLAQSADPTTPQKTLATVRAFCPQSKVNLLHKIEPSKPVEESERLAVLVSTPAQDGAETLRALFPETLGERMT